VLLKYITRELGLLQLADFYDQINEKAGTNILNIACGNGFLKEWEKRLLSEKE
jgi:hypothetical protein